MQASALTSNKKIEARSSAPVASRPFSLTRWFSVLAIGCITCTSLATAWGVSRFFAQRMIERDAQLTMLFVQSAAGSDGPDRYFAKDVWQQNPEGAPNEIEAFLHHIAAQPEVLRANAYDRELRLLWSSAPNLIGRQFTDNDELHRALAGELVVVRSSARSDHKAEHEELGVPRETEYIETYVPLRASRPESRDEVVGVVEVYRAPTHLFETIAESEGLIWITSVAGGALLFAVLFWAVRRADRLLATQRNQLLETQALAIVGELSRAVAHSIRSPLAAIRSSAELSLEDASEDTRASLEAVVRESDRIDGMLRELLSFTPGGSSDKPSASLNTELQHVLHSFETDSRRREVRLVAALEPNLPEVIGDSRLLAQAFSSVLSNALEASPQGTEIRVTLAADRAHREVFVAVQDRGPGMSAEQLARAFEPFFTTKQRGLGIGLALVRHIVTMYGGRVAIESALGKGTRVTFRLKAI
jgi:two-component system sensor histidine kinase HydH